MNVERSLEKLDDKRRENFLFLLKILSISQWMTLSLFKAILLNVLAITRDIPADFVVYFSFSFLGYSVSILC